MKNHCGESVGFSFTAALWLPAAGDFVYAKFSEANVMNYSTFLLFSPSSVMILLVFLVSLFFFFVKDQCK